MLAYVFVLFAVAVRFMPHPLAFTPIAAALLYFGARGPRRQLWVPLALLAASDVILTKIVYSYPLTWDHFVTWAWYAAILLLGTRLRENTNWLRVGGAALASSVSFFSGQYTLTMARQRFPGAPASLDALCRRFDIDLSERVTHGAKIDCALLAAVYLELIGGRQPGLDFARPRITVASVERVTRAPRPHLPSAAEAAAHQAMLALLTAPLWLTET